MPKRLNGAASDQRATRVESRFLLILLTAPELFQAVHKPCRACWLLWREVQRSVETDGPATALVLLFYVSSVRGVLLWGRWFRVKEISSQQQWALAEADEVGCRRGV